MTTMLKIKASNFRSFRQLSYTVNPAGLVAVEGMYEGTKDRSNGAGKSTFLPDLLCWAIYGETTRGKKQVCSNYDGADDVRVEVELPFVSWARTQKRDGTGNTIEIGDIRKYEDAKAELLKHFPPQKVFCSTMILGQGIGERFSAWTPGVRAQTLIELLNLVLWSDGRKKLSADRRGLAGELARAQGAAGVYESQVSELARAPQGDPKKRAAAARSVATLSGSLQKLQVDYSAASKNSTDSMRTLGSWQAQMARMKVDIQQCQADLVRIDQGVACPTCNRPYAKSQIATMKEATRKKQSELETQLQQMGSEYKKLQAAQTQEQGKAGKLTSEINALRPQLDQANIELAATENHAEQMAAAREAHKKSQQDCAAFTACIEKLDLLDKAFFEIPIWKIEGVLGIINQNLVEVCNEIWESEFLVQLTSEHALKKGGAKAEIGLAVESRAGDYLGSSPGQCRKIDITVQLAIKDLLMSAWPNALPLLVCDDVIDVLDPYSRRRFYERYLIPAAQKSAVFVLTPAADYPVPIARRIVVGYTEDQGSMIVETNAQPVVEFNAA